MPTRTFTAIYERDGAWWIASVEEVPGAMTQGATLDEARENLQEAVALIIETNRELREQEAAGKELIREELTVTL